VKIKVDNREAECSTRILLASANSAMYVTYGYTEESLAHISHLRGKFDSNSAITHWSYS